ncbi:MAG: hypothetical protein IJM49_01820 [Firmicutes bacterium]|nr:hypothetical protein [Bacillota bacterium]
MAQGPIRGCQEGKATAKLYEVSCPKCGAAVEVFVHMGGGADKTGRTVYDEMCPACSHVIKAGTPKDSLKVI